MKSPHKVMTIEEYTELELDGWHEVCLNVDGFGGVGIRYTGDTEIGDTSQYKEGNELDPKLKAHCDSCESNRLEDDEFPCIACVHAR